MGYKNERALQDIIPAHPSLVMGSLTSETEIAVVCREFQSGVGPADVVMLDDHGYITLVECKLASNREVRREVVGQVLDYASRIWEMSVDEFEKAWTRAAGRFRRQRRHAAVDSGQSGRFVPKVSCTDPAWAPEASRKEEHITADPDQCTPDISAESPSPEGLSRVLGRYERLR